MLMLTYIFIIHLQENRWQYMKGLLFNVIYGGRIDNTVIAIFLNTVQSQVINLKNSYDFFITF